MRGEGSKADRNFSENSSDLVTRPLDQRDQCETCLNGHDASLMNCKIKSSVVFLKSTFKTQYFPFWKLFVARECICWSDKCKSSFFIPGLSRHKSFFGFHLGNNWNNIKKNIWKSSPSGRKINRDCSLIKFWKVFNFLRKVWWKTSRPAAGMLSSSTNKDKLELAARGTFSQQRTTSVPVFYKTNKSGE